MIWVVKFHERFRFTQYVRETSLPGISHHIDKISDSCGYPRMLLSMQTQTNGHLFTPIQNVYDGSTPNTLIFSEKIRSLSYLSPPPFFYWVKGMD